MRFFSVMMLGVALMTSCVHQKKEAVQPIDTSSMVHHVTVKKVLQANAYSYLYVNDDDQQYWIAVNKMEPVVGEAYYFSNAMEMNDFKSTDLDTVFSKVFFVEKISSSKEAAQGAQMPQGSSGRKPVGFDSSIHVDPAEGGVTVAALFGKRADYAGKEVTVSGRVVKVNKGIMGRNWVHIQDGTRAGDKYDLTLTTSAEVAVGDVVTMHGTVALNKDFGAGYFYDVIVEGAVAD